MKQSFPLRRKGRDTAHVKTYSMSHHSGSFTFGSVEELPLTPSNWLENQYLRQDPMWLRAGLWGLAADCQLWETLGKSLHLSKSQFPHL